MSAEPVAWMCTTRDRMEVILYEDQAFGTVTPLYAQSPAVARAMAIAEAARVCEELANKCSPDWRGAEFKEAYQFAEKHIRALSSPPSVTEEWVNERILSVFDKRPETADLEARYAVRATLAALGVKVEGAAK